MPSIICPVTSTVLSRQNDLPTDSIHTEAACTAQYKGTELGSGRFYINESDLAWIREDTMGFRLEYKQLIAHAVCRDRTAYPRDCVYMLYEGGPDSDSEEGEVGNVEIRIAPENENTLQRIFEAISDGQLLHPDQEDESDEEEEEGEVGGPGLGMSRQIRFDSDGQLMMGGDAARVEEEDERRFEDMEEG